MRKFLIAVLFGLTTAVCFAQPSVSIRTEAAPREIYIGDPIAIGVFVTISSDVALMPLTLPTTGDFEILSVSSPTVAAGKDGKNTVAYQFAITTFSTGTLSFPPITLSFATAGGAQTQANTEAIQIKVKSLLQEKGDEGNIRPLKGLYNFKSYFWLWMLLLAIVLGTGGYYGWQWINRRPGETGNAPAGPPRPPEEVAWEAIHALEDADLITLGQIREFYYRLSEIFRQYLEHRYNMSALDKTTSELLVEFRQLKFTTELLGLCRDFFENADLVKFAKYTPLN